MPLKLNCRDKCKSQQCNGFVGFIFWFEQPDTLLPIQKEDGTGKECPLEAVLEATKNNLIQGSTKLLLVDHFDSTLIHTMCIIN